MFYNRLDISVLYSVRGELLEPQMEYF